MSKEKDFEQAAMDYCEDHSHCIYFEAGAEHGYQYAVEKASNVILSIIRDIYGYDGNDPMPYEIQEKLRKIMEE